MVDPRKCTRAVLVALALPLVAAAQPDGAPTKARALERTRFMLEQRPTHAALFDRYFSLLVETNSIDSEIDALRERSAADPQPSLSIVLGRVLLRAGHEDDALAVLEGIPAKDPSTLAVLGDIYFKLARFDAAARAFQAAMPGATTADRKRILYEKTGKALLALGKKEAALAAWGRIADLDGGKFFRRLAVAELLADAGLIEEAEAAYRPLLLETEADPARHCQVLRDLGRLLELRGDVDAALSTYDRVLALTGRGNWLRKEVEKRIIQIHHRTGRLADLVERLEQRVAEAGDDLASSELLANVLLEMRELDRAVEVLAKMSPRFPNDVRLARRVAELYIERDDLDSAIAEYQRIIDERPEELELYLELGTMFARSERFTEAKNQWEKALARNLQDASLCARLASMYALWDRGADAGRLYRRAIELEPESMVRYVDCAEYLFSHKLREEAVEILDRALEKARGHARRLEALVPTLREHELFDRAAVALESILGQEPHNHEVRYALADLLLTRGEVERARPLLWQVVEEDERGSAQRTAAANTLVQLAVADSALDELCDEARRRDNAGALFVIGRARSRERDFPAAIAAYRRALAANPSDLEARRLLARLLAEEGDFDGALEQYRQLGTIAPGERRLQFREVAQLHLERYDLDAAVATWEQAMRDNPDNAAVFLQVGREFLSIQRLLPALDAFRQAARLRPNDPEILLRLADALAQAGKPAAAQQHLVRVATHALDSRDREQARTKLFDLHAEQGEIDRRIEELQGQVAENPYDQDAPQLLADLYMRTGDFVLGLEMVERVVRFQPRNRELLARRAELLESLEEWEEVIAAHEELLKFPDADRDQHLIGIGRAQFELGKAADAKATFRKIRDRGRVRRMYAQYRMHDEAVDYYRRAIAKDPSDVRTHLHLAQELEKLAQRREAIDVLERALNLRPYYRQALELVGKLYVQDGRREDAVRVGMRLFGLRGEDVEPDRREAWEDERRRRGNRWSSRRATRPFSQRRLQAAQSYFDSRGLKQQWGEILVAEARRRPADLALYQAVQQHYRWREKSADKFAAFVRELLGQDFDGVRIPPGYTRRSYREKLETDLVSIWDSDAKVAERRVEELAGEGRSAAELVERARARRALGRLEAMNADLESCLRLEPEHPIARVLLVESAVERKDYAAAIPHLEALIRWWDGPGELFEPELAARREQEYRRQRKAMLDALPRRLRRRVDDATLRLVLESVRQQEFARLNSLSFPESIPSRFACVAKLIRVRRAVGDDLGATILQARAIARTIAERASLGRILFQEERHEAAAEVLESVVAEADALRADPVQVYFWRYYAPVVKIAAGPLGELLQRRGDHQAAYRVLRENGEARKAELLLRQGEHAGTLREALERAVTERGRSLSEARAGSASDLRTLELDYRDAVIQHADYYVGEKDFAEAERLYRASLELLPDDLPIRDVVARLCERRGDYRASIAMHEEVIAVKRRRRRATAGETAIPPTRLQPTLPGASPQDQSAVASSGRAGPPVAYSSSLSSIGSSYTRYTSSSARNRFDVGTNYARILQLYAERDRPDEVLATMRKIMQEDPATFRNMSWQLLDVLRNQDLGKRKLPILRILRGVVKNDDWLTLEYARACRDEGDLEEAKRTLEKMIVRGLGTASSRVESAEKELKRVLQRLGEYDVGTDRLRAAVDADPDNVRHRLRLARQLKKDHEYAAALEQARVVAENAPYLNEAKELVVDTAAAAGEDDVAIEMLRRLFDEATNPNDKVRRGVNLANWLHARGDVDEAEAIIDGLEEQSGGTRSFSPGNWFLDKDRMEKALSHYERELERHKSQAYRLEQFRQRIARLEFAADRDRDAIRRYLTAIDEAASLKDRESRWKDLLRVVKGHPRPDQLAASLAAEHADRTDVHDHLVMASLGFASGDVAGAEADLRRAVEMSPKEVYVYPLLFGLRRLAGDYDGALAILDEMTHVYGGSDTMQWSSGTSMSERDRFKLVRADLFEEMGRQEDADALIQGLADETEPSSLQRLSQVYQQRERFDDALATFRRYTAKLGTREQSHLVGEARLLLELGRIDEARELVDEAYVMARGDWQTRDLLIQIHRREGRLPVIVERFEAELAKDFRDGQVRSTLLRLYEELRRVDDRQRLFERMLGEDDMREDALESLAKLASGLGDHARQLRYLEQRLPLCGGDERKSLCREIATVKARLGDVDGGIEHLLQGIDPDTADGQLALGKWLQRHERHRQALAAFQRAREMDAENEAVTKPLIESAWRLSQHALVVEQIARYERERRAEKPLLVGELHTWLCDAVAGLAAAERDRLLAGGDGSVAGLELAALSNWAFGRFEPALARSREAIALSPTSPIANELRRLCLWELNALPELLEATEATRSMVEREFVVSADWDYYNRAQKLQNDIGRVHHLLGDDDRAELAWRQSPVRRTPYSNPFSFWRNDWGVRYTAELWLGVRRPERALRALDREFLLRESPPWSTLTRALDEQGRLDEVEGLAWRRFLDPLELYGVQSGSYGWVWIGGEYRRAVGMQEFLVDFYRRRNRLEQLRERARSLSAEPSTSRQAEQLLQAIAKALGDYTYLARERETRLEARELPPTPTEAHQMAVLWRQAGDVDRALSVMRGCLDFALPTLDAPVLHRSSSRRYYDRFGASSDSQRNPFSFNFDNSQSSWWSTSGRGDLDVHRRTAAALLWRTGDTERATLVEQDLLDHPTPARRRKELRDLAKAHGVNGAHVRAAHLWRRLLDDEDADLEDSDRDDLWKQLVTALQKAGDTDGARATARERLASLDDRIRALPGPHAFALRAARARLLIDDLGDHAAGIAELDFLLKFRPSDHGHRVLRAIARIRNGDSAGGAAALRDLSERRRSSGEEDTLAEQAWLGIALARSGEPGPARQILTRVLQRLEKDGELRRLAQSAMDSL